MKKLNPKPSADIASMFPRADPALLATFDERSKRCEMGCGQHALDPRSWKECKFMCGDCSSVVPRVRVIHVNPPIPDRSFDYRASWADDYPNELFGWGASEEEAERDLRERSN